jgi:hypothetical protein
LSLALGSLAAAPGAHAAAFDPDGFRLQSSDMYVHENAGSAVITVERNNTSEAAQIRYITIGVPAGTAVGNVDFIPVKGELDFSAGQESATFSVPIIDHGVASIPQTIQVSLFGPSPIGMADPRVGTLTILNDDPAPLVDPNNPLGVAPVNGNPLVGAQFFVDHQSTVAKMARRYHGLRVIAREPGTARFGKFSGGDVGVAVARYLSRAAVQEPGTVPLLATYRVVDGHCHHWADPPADQASYHNFIERFAAGIGTYRAVLFLEMDSLITSPCLSRLGVAVRMQELSDAIDTLKANCPRLVIYLDAGAADALRPRDAARLHRLGGG